ncbi:MAG: ABC transporter ATP-binding protein [Planctomycetota bacterium]|jgi:ABC-2 type transport system ATP-binding protein
MNEPAIRIEGLEFSYGRNKVLRGVDLSVPRGSIFGFLGRNGAGKTTTIKLLLGLLKPEAGVCRVDGLDSVRNTIAVRRAVGYMAEDQRMFGWMRVGQIIKWVGSFYPGWDDKFVGKLLDLLELPRRSRVRNLSKGQNSRLALLLALGHRPKVVILDDPTLGLDPIARKDFLRYVIGLLQSNGVTVFFSSHLLYEIEPVADYVAILEEGAIVKWGTTDELRKSIKKLVLSGADGIGTGDVEGILDIRLVGDRVAVTVQDFDEAKRTAIEKQMGSDAVREVGLNLDEIFEAYVIGNRGRDTGT